METKETKGTAEQKTVTGHTPGAGGDALAPASEIKRKRKYSRGSRTVQEVGRGVNNAAADLAGAVSSALETYRKRANESSYNKRDGMLRDAVENWVKAGSKGVKRAADVPYDLVKTVTRGKTGKQVRGVAKMFAPPMFR